MILLDFDGTLVDLWDRYYSVFKDILGLTDLGIEEYKNAKQFYHKDSLVAEHFGKFLPADYFSKKAILLEETKYLSKDRLLIEASLLNQFLKQDAILFTKRRNKTNFKWQLQELGIEDKSIIIESCSKKEWIKQNFPEENCIIVGDSMEDLEAASLDNVEAWMVGYGLFTKSDFNLKGLPYLFFETPNDLSEMICRRGD